MNAYFLTRFGNSVDAFELRKTEKPTIQEDEVLIKVEAFGLNYADIMARKGLYKDAPPLPGVLGYDVCGSIESVGAKVTNLKVGQRVTAMTRFGGYAEFAVTNHLACVPIPEEMEAGVACALATQYCTAYFCAHEAVNLYPGDKVLIQAAAGGVGTALVQLCKHLQCVVFGTAGSDKKLEYLSQSGVDYPINYQKQSFSNEIKKVIGDDGLDVAFDSVGGAVFKDSFKLLGHGGRLVGYGAAERSGSRYNIPATLKLAWQFGIYHPIQLLMGSRGIIGVNMLRIADHRPLVLRRCLENVVKMTSDGILSPHVGGEFKSNELSQAHEFVGSRKSVGKVVVRW